MFAQDRMSRAAAAFVVAGLAAFLLLAGGCGSKAQTKLDNCQGDCEKERRKLAEAKAKYARKASELEAN